MAVPVISIWRLDSVTDVLCLWALSRAFCALSSVLVWRQHSVLGVTDRMLEKKKEKKKKKKEKKTKIEEEENWHERVLLLSPFLFYLLLLFELESLVPLTSFCIQTQRTEPKSESVLKRRPVSEHPAHSQYWQCVIGKGFHLRSSPLPTWQRVHTREDIESPGWSRGSMFAAGPTHFLYAWRCFEIEGRLVCNIWGSLVWVDWTSFYSASGDFVGLSSTGVFVYTRYSFGAGE